jgi:hypothetical protein
MGHPFNLGLNSDSIAFEVAIEALGQSRQPLMQALAQERASSTPSAALIAYYAARLRTVDALQDELTPKDVDIVRRILAGDPLLVVRSVDPQSAPV